MQAPLQAPNANVLNFTGRTTKNKVMVTYQNKSFTFTKAARNQDGQIIKEYWKCTTCSNTLMYEIDPDNNAYIAEPEARHGYFNLVVGIQKFYS